MIPIFSARTLCGHLIVGLMVALLIATIVCPVRAGHNTKAPQATAPSLPIAAGNGGPSPLELADCLRIALQRQPRIAAQQASLAAAEEGSRALEGLKLAALVDLEIPIRRRQAALGVAAARS